MLYKIKFESSFIDELWKEIMGFPNYEISNYGRVKSLSRKVNMPKSDPIVTPDILMSPGILNSGYQYVNLVQGDVKKTLTVHRLVALHFVDNPNPVHFKIVRHLDNNKRNNHHSNLNWCNHSINNAQAWSDGIKSKDHLRKRKGADSPSAKPVSQYTKSGIFIKTYPSRVTASSETGIPQGSINMAAGGYQKLAGGFIWRAVK